MTLREVLDELNVPYADEHQSHHVTPGWLGLDCPSCSPNSGKFKLGVNESKLGCSCWSCGRTTLVDSLVRASGRSRPAVYNLLKTVRKDYTVRESIRTGTYREPPGVGPLLPVHVNYLEGRGFDVGELAELWQIKGVAMSKRLSWRIFIPVISGFKRVSWTTRATSPKAVLRYVNADPCDENRPIKDQLYGSHLAGGSVVVVEGPTDAWRIGPGAVATFGSAWTPAQLLALSRYSNRTVMFDPEPVAQASASRLCQELRAFPGVTRKVVLDSGDPGDMTPEQVAEVRRRYL